MVSNHDGPGGPDNAAPGPLRLTGFLVFARGGRAPVARGATVLYKAPLRRATHDPNGGV
jgi:hypothetical protein